MRQAISVKRIRQILRSCTVGAVRLNSQVVSSHAAHLDGGQVAFIGFLYQMVGVAALQAWAHVPAFGGVQRDFEPLLGILQSGELYHDWLDQDAVVITNREDLSELTRENASNLIQFKFSQVNDLLDKGDLTKIVDRFRVAAERWPTNLPPTTGFWLITNRPPNSDVETLMSRQPSERSLRDLQRKSQKSNAEDEILRRLRIISRISLHTVFGALTELARQYGAEEDEVHDGMAKLIGELVMHSAGGVPVPVSRERVLQAITTGEKPHRITCDQVAIETRLHLSTHATYLHIPGETGGPVRRGLLRQIEEDAATHALVVLLGNGGSGKSVLLWELLHDVVGDLGSAPRACAEILPVSQARALFQSWSWIIAQWANAPEGSRRYTEEPAQALKRLRMANPGIERPLLYLGLDGLDERIATDPSHDAIASLLRWFWNEERNNTERARRGNIVRPEATLIVTCREREEIEERWLDISPSARADFVRPTCRTLMDFDDDELAAAAHAYLPQLSGRFGHTNGIDQRDEMRHTVGDSYGLEAASLGIAPQGAVPSVSIEVLQGLRHPAMWRALLELPQEQHANVLDGDPFAVRDLACAFVKWFIYRVRRRGRLNLDKDDLQLLLNGIAMRCSADNAAAHSFTDWSAAACGTHVVAPLQASRAWYEALSGGLIMRDAGRTWRWYHPFVWKYLAGAGTDEEVPDEQ